MVGSLNGPNGFDTIVSPNKFQINMPNNNNAFGISDRQDTPLKGKITKDQLIDDQELAQDLETLTNEKFINTEGVVSDNLTADKTVKAFSKVMGDYMNDVNTKQKDAEGAVETFASGGNIDLHNVMIAMEKSNLSMQLTLQLRNKILQAYQEISKIPV